MAVASYDEIEKVQDIGNSNRTVGATLMNACAVPTRVDLHPPSQPQPQQQQTEQQPQPQPQPQPQQPQQQQQQPQQQQQQQRSFAVGAKAAPLTLGPPLGTAPRRAPTPSSPSRSRN